MPIFEDPAKTKFLKDKSRPVEGSTKGFRHITEIGFDDLTYKVLKHFEACGNRAMFLDRVMGLGENVFQSPIERAVFAFFLTSDFGIGVEDNKVHTVLPGDPFPKMLFEEKSVAICPQHQVESYFLDFGVFINTGDFCMAFDFECDGIDFHGRNNAQISHDFNRDRVLSENKFQIYRASGSDINKHPLYEVEKFGLEVESQLTGLRRAA